MGHTPVAAVELESFPRSILTQRFDNLEIFGDIRTFHADDLTSQVDMISGGFPCQSISAAGSGEGITPTSKSGLWFEMLRVIEEVQPTWVFAENSPRIRNNGLTTVIDGLESAGYGAAWGYLSASYVRGVHERKRWWMLAKRNHSTIGETFNLTDLNTSGWSTPTCNDAKNASFPPSVLKRKSGIPAELRQRGISYPYSELNPDWVEEIMGWPVGWTNRNLEITDYVEAMNRSERSWSDASTMPPAVDRGSTQDRTARLVAIGNGQVPQVAQHAYELLMRMFV